MDSDSHPREARPVASPSFRLADFQARSLRADELSSTPADAADSDGASGDGENPHAAGADSIPERIRSAVLREVAPDATGVATGILDVRPEGFGFLRSALHNWRPSADDVFLSGNQIRRLRLKTGHEIEGVIRLPRRDEQYFAMLRVRAVDNSPIEERPRGGERFETHRRILPHARLRLAHQGAPRELRVLDRLVPLALGQRILIHAPTRFDRGAFHSQVAAGVLANHPMAQVILVGIDQAPERAELAASAWRSEARATAVSSTFDDSPESHIDLVRMALARADRLAERGDDVVLLLDSITDLVRAHNLATPHSGKIIRAGLDANALRPPKKLLAHARQREGGGSVTIFGTLHATETMDGPPGSAEAAALNLAIAAEFDGSANAEITVVPGVGSEIGIDPFHSFTREEDNVLPSAERGWLRRARQKLRDLGRDAAMRLLHEDVSAEDVSAEDVSAEDVSAVGESGSDLESEDRAWRRRTAGS